MLPYYKDHDGDRSAHAPLCDPSKPRPLVQLRSTTMRRPRPHPRPRSFFLRKCVHALVLLLGMLPIYSQGIVHVRGYWTTISYFLKQRAPKYLVPLKVCTNNMATAPQSILIVRGYCLTISYFLQQRAPKYLVPLKVCTSNMATELVHLCFFTVSVIPSR
jgi:hypothetical protein